MRRFFGFIASIALFTTLAGCAPPDVSGSWSGTWTVDLVVSNSLTMTLTQTGTNVTGTSSIGGSFCVPNGNVTATVDATTKKLNGSFTNNVGTVNFNGDIGDDATHLSGTFTANGAGCGTNTTGTFSMDREGS